MAVKVGNRLIGENPSEQFKQEKRRFEARLIRELNKQALRRIELEWLDDGNNRKITEF